MLTKEDKENIDLRTERMITKTIPVAIKAALDTHITSCPHGKTLLISKWMLIGTMIGSAGGGIGGGFALAKLVAGF